MSKPTKKNVSFGLIWSDLAGFDLIDLD